MAMTSGVAAQPIPPDQREALNAAERWLEPVDDKRYANAYAMASAKFKSTIDRQEWLDGMRDIRKDYGRVVARKGAKIGYFGQAPGPDYPTTGPREGMQITILFDTKFAGNRQAVEEVVMIYENDGLWRVAGYHIR
jgi:hypothetical protein